MASVLRELGNCGESVMRSHYCQFPKKPLNSHGSAANQDQRYPSIFFPIIRQFMRDLLMLADAQ
jgi:hypothetical protein